MSPRVNNVTRRFIIQKVCTAERRPHARNSKQRLRRAGRFSPTTTWPFPPLSQLEREKIAVPTASHHALPQAADRGKLVRYDRYWGNKIPGADQN